jgi:uncharacterized membrane protein
MKNSFLSKMVSDELRFIIPWVIVIDGIVFLITLPLYRLNIQIPLGLLLGTFIMIVNLTLLGYSAERAVERSVTSAKRYMFLFYMIRFAIMGCALVFAFKISLINPYAAFIPLFYPKVIYTLSPILNKKGG